jgi:hypothetical protein
MSIVVPTIEIGVVVCPTMEIWGVNVNFHRDSAGVMEVLSCTFREKLPNASATALTEGKPA